MVFIDIKLFISFGHPLQNTKYGETSEKRNYIKESRRHAKQNKAKQKS